MRPARAALVALAALAAGGADAAAQNRILIMGQVQSDSLSARDPQGRRRQAPYQLWTFEGRRGQRVVVDMMSREFDSYLVLRDPDGRTLASDDDSGEDNDARVRAVLPRDGRYRVIASAFAAEGRGRYSLVVMPWDGPETPPPGAIASLRTGDTKDGTLEPGDSVGGDGPFEDRWSIEAQPGQRLRVELRSTDFDAYLSLVGPDGRVIASDDDGLGDRNAVLVLRPAARGRYTALVSTYGDDPVSGMYQIALADESGAYADPGISAAVASGETKEGRLETGDSTGSRGLQDRWTFTGRAGQVLRFDVVATQFDPYVLLLHNGMPVDSNDDGGEGTNARLQVVLPANGTYTAVVSAYSENRTGGRYAVTMSLAAAPAGPAQTARLTPGQRAAGRLESGDRRREMGGYEDYWEFDGRPGQQIAIEMRATEFDAYLELRDPRGTIVAEDDDGLEGTDAFVLAGLPMAGRYRVVARRYGDDEATGFYELSMSVAAPPAPPATVSPVRPADFIVGRLEPGDSLMGDSTYADIFIFRPDRAGEVTIDLHSSEFDAYLLIQDASGRTIASDDDGGNGTDARVTARVSAGQTYRVIANSYGEERHSGTYRLAMRW